MYCEGVFYEIESMLQIMQTAINNKHNSPMLRTQTSTFGVLVTPRKFALTTFCPVRDADASLDDAVFAADDGAEAFAGDWF